jgi:hypothetical protein
VCTCHGEQPGSVFAASGPSVSTPASFGMSLGGMSLGISVDGMSVLLKSSSGQFG